VRSYGHFTCEKYTFNPWIPECVTSRLAQRKSSHIQWQRASPGRWSSDFYHENHPLQKFGDFCYKKIVSHPSINIANRLADIARKMPDAMAVMEPGQYRNGQRTYRSITFRELNQQTDRIANGLQAMGVRSGTRLALLVRPSIDFVALTFALFKSGAVIILIDPGMGRENLIDCLAAAEPEGFVAIPLAHVARLLHRKRFPHSHIHVTVGRRWLWGGRTLAQLQKQPVANFQPAATGREDPAAIIFTTGSTGPPKGVGYTHGNFDAQVTQIQERFGIVPGGKDLAGFPMFGLFNGAMGTTTVIPDMDASRPASLDPKKYVEAIRDLEINQSFASPAVWNVVARYCDREGIRLPTLELVLSAGAPVPPDVLERLQRVIHEDGEVFTPYGATEALPVAAIGSREVLGETAEKAANGGGTCVGTAFSGIRWKVIRIDDGPIDTIDDAVPLPLGEIGELVVSGNVVTRQYVTRRDANALAKIAEGKTIWHRMGDVGYLDAKRRFWFCGRKAHRVRTSTTTMFTVTCEAIFNQHPHVFRSALVGMGHPDDQLPAIVCETWPEYRPTGEPDRRRLLSELAELGRANPLTDTIRGEHILLHESLPVDIRHNAKIFREKLAPWAEKQVGFHD